MAVLMMLGTWFSLSTRDTIRATTFVTHSEEQPLSADVLEDISVPPIFYEDITRSF
jgi:hypothetical protein